MKKLIAILLCCALLFGMAACAKKPEVAQTAAELLDLGEKFLFELDYEQALVQFLKVIEIEPMNPRGYTGAADAYLAMGDLDAAQEILQQGFDKTGDEGLLQRFNVVEDSVALPDGRIAPTKNEWGATAFELRRQYISYDELTPRDHELIDIVANATIAQNGDIIYALLTEQRENCEFTPEYPIFTYWGEYKMYISISNPFSGEDEYSRFSIVCEMRPENGMGYKSFFSHTIPKTAEGYESKTRDFYKAPCGNWQYNGTMTAATYDWMMFSTGNEHEDSVVESGNMTDSVRDGVFTGTRHLIRTAANEVFEDVDNEKTISSAYEYGKCTLRNGEVPEDDGRSTIASISGNFSGTLDDEWIREELYW